MHGAVLWSLIKYHRKLLIVKMSWFSRIIKKLEGTRYGMKWSEMHYSRVKTEKNKEKNIYTVWACNMNGR